jgi:phosphatidylethanolamine/phosphatidyl-N-methylethanolamine N-methyltransferase
MGAALPSSKILADAMARQVGISKEGIIVELGAGTGVMTQALLEYGITPDKLLVIEREKQLHTLLQENFPNLKILCADALELENVLSNAGIKKVNAIISSLPFLSMPDSVRRGIQEQMVRSIGAEGMIIQFTYGLQSPINTDELKEYGLEGERVKFVLFNVPPAHVWVYRRLN